MEKKQKYLTGKCSWGAKESVDSVMTNMPTHPDSWSRMDTTAIGMTVSLPTIEEYIRVGMSLATEQEIDSYAIVAAYGRRKANGEHNCVLWMKHYDDIHHGPIAIIKTCLDDWRERYPSDSPVRIVIVRVDNDCDKDDIVDFVDRELSQCSEFPPIDGVCEIIAQDEDDIAAINEWSDRCSKLSEIRESGKTSTQQ